MSAYTSFISDVHKSYRVEKLVLHYLMLLLIICNCDEIAFGTNKHLLILISKNIRWCQTIVFYTIRFVDIGNEACTRRYNF